MNTRNLYILVLASLCSSIASAMEPKRLNLQEMCYAAVSENFDELDDQSLLDLPSHLRLKVLLSRLEYLQDATIDCGETENIMSEIHDITLKIMELLAEGILLSQEEAECILSSFMNYITMENVTSALELVCNLEENQKLVSAAKRWGFEKRIFDSFTAFIDVVKGSEVLDSNLLPDENEGMPIFSGQLERVDRTTIYYDVYSGDELIKRLQVPALWNGTVHGSMRIIAYDPEKNIIGVPKYVYYPDKDLVISVSVEMILEDEFLYTAMNYGNSSHFNTFTKENPVVKIVFNKRSDEIFLITKDGSSFCITLPRCISSLINEELSLQEILTLLIIVSLHKNQHNEPSEQNQQIKDELNNHKIMQVIEEKNPHLAGGLRSIIGDLSRKKKEYYF